MSREHAQSVSAIAQAQVSDKSAPISYKEDVQVLTGQRNRNARRYDTMGHPGVETEEQSRDEPTKTVCGLVR